MEIYVATHYTNLSIGELGMKAVYDRDCLPTETLQVARFTSTANEEVRADVSERFWHMYEKMRWLEELGFYICIDFGSHFYESNLGCPEIK